MVVFDDVFIDQNVYSGLVVGVDHRQKLHELILGAQGVALNQQLQNLIAQVETHNRTLRQRESAIPAAELGTLTVIITHNADMAGMADRVLHLKDGQIVKSTRNDERVPVTSLKW